MKKSNARIGTIMLTAMSFTPVYSLPALAHQVLPNATNKINGPNNVCYNVHNPSATLPLYVPELTTGEWVSFYTQPGIAVLSQPCHGIIPPPCCAGDPNAGGGCFVDCAMVTMADGSKKRIEDVKVGEFVRGRHGESNAVLALARTTLNSRPLYVINNRHYTTHDHVHWTLRGPAAVMPESLAHTWGTERRILLVDGLETSRKYLGLSQPVYKLDEKDLLITESGSTVVSTIVAAFMEPMLPLFDLVVGGSHTYFVDGFLVGGWLRDDDFDYDRWCARQLPDSFVPFAPMNQVA